MTDTPKILKDFVFLDVERLYSLYSQVFEGVADQIIKQYVSSMARGDTQKGAEGNETDVGVLELSRRTENKFLYDHMYNRLEEKLGESIVDASSVKRENMREKLADAPLIRIKGSAEIEDYARVQEFIENFNLLGEAIAYAMALDTVDPEAKDELWQQLRGTKDRKQKAELQRQLKANDPKERAKQIAKTAGLKQDETTLKNLALFADKFYKDGYDITVSPSNEPEYPAYRSPIEKRWLRTSPDMLRSLFGGYAESNWIIVGHATYFPGARLPVAVDDPADLPEMDEDRPMMRDQYRNLFRSSLTFERMFLERRVRDEIVVCPLAIYRAYELPT